MIRSGSVFDAKAARQPNWIYQSPCPRCGFFLVYSISFNSLESIMTKSVLFAALLAAVALTACGKKEEAAAPAAAPATEAAAPAAAPAPDAAAAAPATAPAPATETAPAAPAKQ
jgi:hypothetical protein